jgi:peptidoglycan hydrolase-like protein with peptidoglycan-binding domain
VTGARIPRRSRSSGSAGVRRRLVQIYFQRCPGTDAALGISGLNYTVKIGTSGAVTSGTTAADGKIEIRMYVSDTATLKVMGTEYTVSIRGTLAPFNKFTGVQRRLKMMGYFVGDADSKLKASTEYALLGFQADNGPLKIDGIPDANTQQKIKDKVGE